MFAQRYDSVGQKVGGQFLVTYTSSDQIHPSAAGLPDGGFVVAWASYGESPDSSGWGVFAQRYDGAGQKVGGEFLVNQSIANDQIYSTIGTLADGNLVVTWNGYNPVSNSLDVYARVFAPSVDGMTAVTPEFVVNTNTNGQQDTMAYIAETVEGLAGGRFVVVWGNSSGQDSSDGGVFAQIYEADGTPLSAAQMLVNTATMGSQFYGSVGALADGGFVVTWAGPDGSGNGIFAQRFDADGNKLGDEFFVNTSGHQRPVQRRDLWRAGL